MVAGGLALHKDKALFERYSTAFYEATQLPLMNMSPHNDANDSEAELYFNLARVFGCLFAYFVAYKTVVYVCDRAKTQFLLGWYCVRSKKKLALVIGLGTVGRRLIRNLIDEKFRVIAIESDKDSVHIERAQDLGAQVIVGDALADRVYRRLPFDAVQSIYVVAGDDRKNLEIGQKLLNYSIERVKRAKLLQSDKAAWWQRWFHKLTGKVLLDRKAVCHVQLYDSNMQQLMEQEHFRQAIELSHIEMRHFNAQQNAVRDLIQRDLAKTGVRPQESHEVGLYFIVGFEDLGQEVALGLAHLAHFENLRRSRIVVFCADPKRESERFLARYPKFTYWNSVYETWDNLTFFEDLDSWEFRSGVTDNAPVDPNAPSLNAQAPEAKYGVTFATNTLFTKMPSSASDDDFLKLIFDLTKPGGKVSVNPSVIVCDKDASKSFAWSSEFVDAWKSYAKRKYLQPVCLGGQHHPALTTYFWLQGHKALKELVKDNDGHFPFGLEEYCIATNLLDSTLLRQLASVVGYSYGLAISKDKVEEAKLAELSPVRFEDLQSDLQAAAHSIIKYRIAGRTMDPTLVKNDVSLPKIGTLASFSWEGNPLTDPTAADNAQSTLIKLGQIEHNRWMAEQLLKGYEFIIEEKPRVIESIIDKMGNPKERNVRLPQYEHQRQTLCPWDQLPDHEKLKDLRQAYYVLYHLSALDSKQGESS